MEDYGDWMLDRREFFDAALAFEISGKASKAMMAYEKAHAWRPLFTLAMKSEWDEERIKELSYRVAGTVLPMIVRHNNRDFIRGSLLTKAVV
jgi:elongator complex protein 1